MGHVVVRASAKINLQLGVGTVRPDGYHSVATVYHAVALFDEVVAATGEGLQVTVQGEQASLVPADRTNLAARAAILVAKRSGIPADVHLTIRKGIPVAGGMAGGSADAAAALIACDELWGCEFSRDELAELAAQLGSDVPFALVGGTAMGHGRGERLSPVLGRGRFVWVLALAAEGLSTPLVYAECDRLRGQRILPEPRVSDALMSALRAGDSRALGASLSNDLGEAACSLRPVLREVLDFGLQAGALGATVSGSGPTCAFLVHDDAHASELQNVLERSPHVRAVVRTHGPVPGARILRTTE